MKKTDWRRAMLNEAEASGNAEWAKETRRSLSVWQLWMREIKSDFWSSTVLMAAGTAFASIAPELYSAQASFLSASTLVLGLTVFLISILAFLPEDDDSYASSLSSWLFPVVFMYFNGGMSTVLLLQLALLWMVAVLSARLLVNRFSRPL